jgi:hypothetical protein
VRSSQRGRGRGHGAGAGTGAAVLRHGADAGARRSVWRRWRGRGREEERAVAVARRLGESTSTAATDEKERWIEIQPYG